MEFLLAKIKKPILPIPASHVQDTHYTYRMQWHIVHSTYIEHYIIPTMQAVT